MDDSSNVMVKVEKIWEAYDLHHFYTDDI